MTNNFDLDFNIILQDYLSSLGEDSGLVLSKLIEIEDKYPLDDVAEIYNYFLQNVQNLEVLKCLIKRINTIKPESCLETLLDMLLLKKIFKDNLSETEKYIEIRVNTAKVISNYKDNKAVLPLLYCMNNKDEHYKIRLACAEALGKIGDKYAVTPLIDLVSDEDEKSVYVRESAAVALGMIGDMRAVDSLVNILEAKKTFMSKFTFLKEVVR